MSTPGDRGPIVIDTDVFSADLIPKSPLPGGYALLIAGRPAFISFQTVAELRFGAIRRGWGSARMVRLEAKLARAVVVHTGDELATICARLRADCESIGHALCQKHHNGDLWIAATAIRLSVPLVSNDQIFRGVPDLEFVSVPQA